MAVWKWYTARVGWMRIVIAVAVAGVVLALVWGTISSLTDEDEDDDDDDKAADGEGTRASHAPTRTVRTVDGTESPSGRAVTEVG